MNSDENQVERSESNRRIKKQNQNRNERCFAEPLRSAARRSVRHEGMRRSGNAEKDPSSSKNVRVDEKIRM